MSLYILYPLVETKERKQQQCNQEVKWKSKIYVGLLMVAYLVFSKIGSFLNYIRYKFTMDNSEKGGSLKNSIHAHYDLSNDLDLNPF